ncbi:MAG: DUF4040 domain-containing protein [Candidatus Omnitrophota bacterium]|nr:DUF4040 domain-containing protein [Candidatus Omnitrophota bacterium]
MIETINILLILFALVCGVAAVYVRELVSATFLLGAYSFFLAVLWAVLAAVDVAFTEAMVGVGASTIFLVLALFRSKHSVAPQPVTAKHVFAFFLIAGLGLLFFWGSADLPFLGDALAPANLHVSPYYIRHAMEHSHTPNMVTAVVVDYRGFDTLIESVVIFTAGVACLLVMRTKL